MFFFVPLKTERYVETERNITLLMFTIKILYKVKKPVISITVSRDRAKQKKKKEKYLRQATEQCIARKKP